MTINQQLDELDKKVAEYESYLAEVPDRRALLTNRATIAELSVQYGRWATVRPALGDIKLNFSVGETSLGPLPPKSLPHLRPIGELLMEFSKSSNDLGRVFYLAPVLAVGDKGKPLDMPLDAKREWRNQKGEGKSGKDADRCTELDAWHYLVFSWNTAFPQNKVKETEDGRVRSHSGSGSERPKSPSAAASSGTRLTPPPSWVVENTRLLARIQALEDELAESRLIIQSQDRQLSDLDQDAAPCPMCPHCFPPPIEEVETKKDTSVKDKGKQTSPKPGSTKPVPPTPPKKEKRKEDRKAKEEKSSGPAPSSPRDPKKKPDLKLEDAKAIRQVLGLPHRDSVEGLTTEQRNEYYHSSRLPGWAQRGYTLKGKAFLDDVKEGRVTKNKFNDWFVANTQPTRANLVAEWTEIKVKFTGVRLTARPSTAAEQKYRGAYERLRLKAEKLGETDVVPRNLPDRGPSRSRSRGRSTRRAGSSEPRGPSQQPAPPAPSGAVVLTEQQLEVIVQSSVRAALEAAKQK
jgi:hypothetical protein